MIHRHKARLLVALLASICSTPARAEDPGLIAPADTSAYRLDEVVIEALRPVTTIGGASGIDVEVSSLPSPAAPTMEDVLREVPLLHVRTNSRGEAEISARGSESRQVAVLVDGIPITLAWDARADVSVIPAFGQSELVYVRGLSSMLYGPNVLGGIIEATTGGSPGQQRQGSAQFTTGMDDMGSFGSSISGSVPVAAVGAKALLRGGVAYRNTPGQPLARNVVEPVPGDEGLRVNTDAENLSGFVSLSHETRHGAWLSLSVSAFRETRGIAAELGVPDEDARLWRYPLSSRALVVASGGTGFRSSPVGGHGDLEASVGLDLGKTEIDSYTSRLYEEIASFEHGRDRTLSLRLLGDHSLGRKGNLRIAYTHADVRHEETLGSIDQGATTTTEATYRQRLWSLGAETDWDLLTGGGGATTITASVGGAYDAASTPESGGREPKQDDLSEWGARAGLSLSLSGGRTVVHAGASRRGRFPALRELYSGALNRFAPNPDLEPERLQAIESGVTTRIGRGSVQVVAFYHRLKDAVVRISLPDRRFMRVNRNELESVGGEVLASQTIGQVTVSMDLTVQNVNLTDTAENETHRPENLPEQFGSLGATFPLARGAEAGARVAYTGSQSSIDPGTGDDTELDAEVVLGAHVSRAWGLRSVGPFTTLQARIAVDNATDVALYDSAGLPGPGRRFRFELRLF